ncbi:carbohydrate ABC transporter permease [Agrobacterium rosae]|uniref:Carbohydrate ABC transporter permease n=1 Tax=Agrobacterium rosae TaxID=1972867 RepID=A0AAE5RZF1_9HYPH|nr:carbohydrate ABC transporter permease [Agrobacterium rosae]KAA3509582.1 carbohydrate ABC transporter permease [Agrobacterium rosae]KAA3516483.1 carbohydrate ABC transporter permease [Agrobacterium rosae]MCM2434998.1 carbohydrate ABC transporter permease [Agrobacterium rosae]MDX8330780.1 carbohydrate ABC transporter permease [Agrobacterium rosae]MQB50282.1 carbohydrate ABC transporter permease [Agrobacterium rosae]
MKTDLSPRLRVALYGLMCVLLIPFVFPTWWMVTSSIKPISDIFAFPPQLIPQTYDWTTYSKVFELQPFVQQYWNSAYIAAVVTIGTMVVSSMAGYAFARIRFPYADTIFMIVLLGLLIPSEVTIVPLFQIFLKAGMVNTHWPLILVPIFGAPSVFATFVMRQFYVTLPAELEEAARVDGLGRFKIFRKIALPLAKPALASVAIFTFLHSWNLFLEPIVFLSSADKFTLPQALTQYTDAYGGPMWNIQLAAATLTALPVLIVFIIAQKQFVEGLAHTGLKG